MYCVLDKGTKHSLEKEKQLMMNKHVESIKG